MTINQEYDVIIVGSGFTGLTAGLTLSSAGKKVLILERRKEQLVLKIQKEKDNIEYLKSKIERLLKVNFELLDNPSHQIKVTLNYEENLILEELVKKEGSNKSSVIRNMIKDFSNATKEKNALELKLEKINTERRLELQMLERENIHQLEITYELVFDHKYYIYQLNYHLNMVNLVNLQKLIVNVLLSILI